MNDVNENAIKKEFKKILLSAEKENLARVTPNGDSIMVSKLKVEFEKVVKNNGNKQD